VCVCEIGFSDRRDLIGSHLKNDVSISAIENPSLTVHNAEATHLYMDLNLLRKECDHKCSS
jgi:hypothetical protein